MITITGEVVRTFFNEGSYSIRSFESNDIVMFPNGSVGRTFSIKGVFIPEDHVLLKCVGDFDPKPYKDSYGEHYTFLVESCEEIKVKEKAAIIKYLKTLQGVGSALASTIFSVFGLDTYDILDQDIERLKEVPGIGAKNFETISKDYLSRGIAKELYTYLYKYNVTNKRVERIFKEYREKSIDVIKAHPHSFYINGMLSFNAAEKIMVDENLDRLSEERIEASCKETLYRAENLGNTFLPWGDLLRGVLQLLSVKESREISIKIAEKVRTCIKQMGYGIIDNKKTVSQGEPVFYLKETSKAEFGTASGIHNLLNRKMEKGDYMEDIKLAQTLLGVSLSEEQEKAVQMVMNSPISVVTGGPGTGKTTFQKVLFEVYKKHHPELTITLGAPTGRAARRMTESSNLPARTLHKILGLAATDDGDMIETTEQDIPEGLIVIDEVSMLDIFLSNKLFSSIPENAQIVCIGDIYQLPSVGPGTVLKSLIDSEAIPTARFTKIFRQKEGSCIAQNAMKINQGDKDLEFDDAFCFVERNTPADIVSSVTRLYERAVAKYGVDDVTVLTPFRRNTVTGVNQLNPVLKQLINPLPATKGKTTKIDNMNIYVGDRVMFTKNKDELTNGDIGYVKEITYVDRVQTATVDFMDGRVVSLSGDDLQSLVLAYSTTIHKSQGSEYKCCIIIIDPEHERLLKRNLIYTAITRAKEKVVLVGSKEAFYNSIDIEDTTKRNSQLSDLIKASA